MENAVWKILCDFPCVTKVSLNKHMQLCVLFSEFMADLITLPKDLLSLILPSFESVCLVMCGGSENAGSYCVRGAQHSMDVTKM